jgi:hypothetical protein
LHWILDNSQIRWSSHQGDGSQGQWSATASPPTLSWMLDDKGGEDSGLKTQICDAVVCCLCCTGVTGALHRSDRCLLAIKRSHVIS